MAEKKKAIKFNIYRDKTGQYRWQAIHRNGRILADSGEAYTRLRRCESSVKKFVGYIESKEYTIVIL